MWLFEDREEAAIRLAEKLASFKNQPKTLVIGLPRGGVVTAAVVADELNLPLDIIIPRKIGHPDNPEFALAAISEKGTPTNPLPQSPAIEAIIEEEKKEIKRRIKLYRKDLPPRDLQGKTIIIVDDGIATGHTMEAAVLTAKEEGAAYIIIATPLIPPGNISKIEKLSDELIYLNAPLNFYAIGQFYQDFPQTSDEKVYSLLH